jgi:hypothetical protein
MMTEETKVTLPTVGGENAPSNKKHSPSSGANLNMLSPMNVVLV